MIVLETFYQNIRDWDSKVFSIPKIPRSSLGYHESLKVILNALINNEPYNKPLQFQGSNRKDTLERLLVFLRPTGIVRKKSINRWEMSEEIKNWLDKGNNFELAVILQGNIRYFSEILHVISKQPSQMKHIRDAAINNYKLPWKGKSEILNRLGWLQDLGLVVYQDFSHNYILTKEGEHFLNEVGYFDHENIKVELDETALETEVPISKWARNLCSLSEVEFKSRKNGIGYFPSNGENIHETVYEYLLLLQRPISMKEIREFSAGTFNLKESSVNSMLTAFINLDLINKISSTHYQVTNLGRELLEDNNALNFASCVHKKCNFVFEILIELNHGTKSIKQLQAQGLVSYNLVYKDKSELRKRIRILRSAKLIQEIGIDSFKLTKRGENFYDLIKDNLNKMWESRSEDDLPATNFHSNIIENCLNEIRLSARDSSDPVRFEKAIQKGFGLLGYNVEHLGGAGKTDILLQAPTAPKFAYSVSVDAKSTYHSSVSETSIDFDTIIEHKNIHNAEYAAIVGISFQGSRLIKRAQEKGIILIDVDSLESLIKGHVEVPLKTDSYRKIFEHGGLVNLKVLEEDRKKITREGKLLQAIIKCLSDQSNDPYTHGIVQPREIYLLLKLSPSFEIPPGLDEITNMLKFLSSPLIKCVGVVNEGYYALGSLNDAAKKFEFYLKSCKEL